RQAAERLPDLPEWQDDAFKRRHTFPSFSDALARIHNPKDPIDVAVEGSAWRRLAYDEFLAGQVSLALVRARIRRLSGRPLVGDGRIVEKLRAALPY
ncbi:ATP-dependent DNA helicase RecG, partial [Mesorhizobium sp. M2E.F.Ca.ET.154.01.1.1]